MGALMLRRGEAIVSVTGLVLVAAAQAVGPVTLTDATVSAGLSTAVHQPDESLFPGTQVQQCGGLAAADFDNDGDTDIFWVGGGLTPDRLFINDGTGVFTDEAAAWGIDDLHAGNGVAVGDYNKDGWLDIYLTSFGTTASPGPGQHRLYRNDSGTAFTNVAAAAGVNYSCAAGTGNPAGYGAAFGDYDLDGDLDLCVTSWASDDNGTRLYRNDGDGTFTDVTVAALDTAVDGIWGFQAAFQDMNEDRYPELLISADFMTSRYLVNNADGTFTDMTAASGTGIDENGMGQTVGDFDRDGLFDWYVTSIVPSPHPDPGNMLYWNQGADSYVECSIDAGVNDGLWGWGALAVDLDQDRWLDILEVNGRPDNPTFDPGPARLFHNQRNVNLPTFVDIASTSGFDHDGNGRALAYLDVEGDGDLDILVSTYGQAPSLYLNETPDIGNWLRIKLDTSTNPTLAPNGFGTRVIATPGVQSFHRHMNSSPSYLGTSELTVHFGMLNQTVIAELRVEWAKGYVTILNDVAVNQHLTISAPQLGDVDADGIVGVTDLLDLLGGWGNCPTPPASCLSDLDNDGFVGVTDLLLLLGNWS